MENNFDGALAEYLKFIKADYVVWQNLASTKDTISQEVKKEAIERSTWSAQHGQKYIKVIHEDGDHRSVHSFVDKDGNIWKAASWKAPAKNFTRGSIFDKASYEKRIRWSGVNQ